MNRNKRNGSALERRFAKALSKNAWVHLLKDNANGQPFDVIAVCGNTAYAYDCKLCKGNIFRCSRIELNQHLAFQRMLRHGNKYCYIAICFAAEADRVYCVPYKRIKKYKSVDIEEVKEIADYIIKLCQN